MDTNKSQGVSVYRIRGFEFVLPKKYTDKTIILSMEYLNNKPVDGVIKGRMYANYYGGYKPVCIHEFAIGGFSSNPKNAEIEDVFYSYIVEGNNADFVEKINLFINEISEPDSPSEFELARYDIKNEKLGKIYGLFFYLPEFVSVNNVEVAILYKKNKEGCLDVVSYLGDKKIPYRVKVFAGDTKIDYNDPYRDSLLFDSFQCNQEIKSVLDSWDILREHMK